MSTNTKETTMSLLKDETDCSKKWNLAVGQTCEVDGFKLTIAGLVVNKKDQPQEWVVCIRYHSTENDGDTNYCYRDTWERWIETGTWYRSQNSMCNKRRERLGLPPLVTT